MRIVDQAHKLQTEAQQEAVNELEAVECMTAALDGCGGLEGGFVAFDQHALMLSTIVFNF
jgi:hypothetical protein